MTDEEVLEWSNKVINRYRNLHPPKREQKKIVQRYLKKSKVDKETTKAILCNPITSFSMVAPYCKLGVLAPLERIPEVIVNSLNRYFTDLETKGRIKQKKRELTQGPRKTVQDYMKEQVGEYLSELEGILDDVLEAIVQKEKTPFAGFKMKNWLILNEVKSRQSKTIAEYLEKTKLEELIALLDDENPDPQLKEGYSYIGRVQQKNYKRCIETIISDCYEHAEKVKPKRKKKYR
jgi:hypothetical protein